MAQQTTITVSGSVGDDVRGLVEEFPGSNINRVGRALVRLGLKQARRQRKALVAELREIDAPWDPKNGGNDGK